MYTQCPECLTVYKVGANILSEGHGSARCGHCAAVFDTLRSLTEQLPGDPFQQLERRGNNEAPPQLTVPALRPTRNPPAQSQQPQSSLFDPDERQRGTPPRRPHTPAFARAHRSQRGRTGLPRLYVESQAAFRLHTGGLRDFSERD